MRSFLSIMGLLVLSICFWTTPAWSQNFDALGDALGQSMGFGGAPKSSKANEAVLVCKQSSREQIAARKSCRDYSTQDASSCRSRFEQDVKREMARQKVNLDGLCRKLLNNSSYNFSRFATQ